MTEESLFHEALSKPEAERAAFLEGACLHRPEMLSAVQALLAAYSASVNPLDQPLPVEPSQQYTFNPSDEKQSYTSTDLALGMIIAGRYSLEQKLGEGGMGEVWVAKQSEPVKRRVALKLIKAGMDSKSVVQRFEQERQALAMMDHPNIAKVLDGGITADRRPFFAMELVNGLPLTKFCDEAKLGIKERLELFVPICQAVQHAHQKGIVHRDLKPGNILVTIIDGKPIPKVIDFGVAKATSGRLTEESLSTQFGAVVGTLEYMSPEQAGFSGEDIDTRADIYSLGVILYELLTGLRPFDTRRLKKAALDEIIRILREEEPSKPSTRLSTDESLPSMAAVRHIEPGRLTALLRGELDWVIMKCLEKQRDRRYETANGLARDIQRYLADEPVEARPPTLSYRLQKFARRNRTVLASTILILAMLIVGLTLSIWQMTRAIAAEEQAKKNEEAAKVERDQKSKALEAEQKARQQAFVALRSMTDTVVENKFARSTALSEEDKAFLRSIIDQFNAFATIQSNDIDSQSARAEAHLRVGMMRFRLGELKDAEVDYNTALDLYKNLIIESTNRHDFKLTRASLHNNRGLLLQNTGRLNDAITDFDNSISICSQLTTEFPKNIEYRQQLVGSLNTRGLLLRDTGKRKEAEEDFNTALKIISQMVAEFPNRTQFRQLLASSHNNKGLLLSSTGRLKEVETEYNTALNLRKQLVADFPNRPEFRQDLAVSYHNHGILLIATGRLKEAEADYDAALENYMQLTTDYPTRPEFRYQLAGSYMNRGVLHNNLRRGTEAKSDYDAALAILKRLASDFPKRPEFRKELAATYGNRQILLSNLGKHKESEADGDAAHEIWKQLSADYPKVAEYRFLLARSHNNRGMLYSDTGRVVDAEAELTIAQVLSKQLVADSHNQPDLLNLVAGVHDNLASLHQQRGDLTGSLKLLNEARPYHLTVLKANPMNPKYQYYYDFHLGLQTKVYAELLDTDNAVRSAETRRDVGWNRAADAYASASILSLCLPIVSNHKRLDESQRDESKRFYTDAAIRLLQEATDKGFKDSSKLSSDPAFAPLKKNIQFQKLLKRIETK